MTTYTARTEQAARTFYNMLRPRWQWHCSNDPVQSLVLAAFDLYRVAWKGGAQRFDIRQWEWPANELQSNGAFQGDQPWAVLLRRAVEIVKADAAKQAA